MKQSGNPFFQCIPTNDASAATWYFDTFSAHSLQCYDMINYYYIQVLLIRVLLTNNKFQKAVNYSFNDQLKSQNNEISHISFRSKHQHCRRGYKNKRKINIKYENRQNKIDDILLTVLVYITHGHNTDDKHDKSTVIDIVCFTSINLGTSKSSIKNINGNSNMNINQVCSSMIISQVLL